MHDTHTIHEYTYRGGGWRGGYPSLTRVPPWPNLFQHVTMSQLQAFWATRNKLREPKFIKFPGGAPLDPPPQEQCASHDQYVPLPNRILAFGRIDTLPFSKPGFSYLYNFISKSYCA